MRRELESNPYSISDSRRSGSSNGLPYRSGSDGDLLNFGVRSAKLEINRNRNTYRNFLTQKKGKGKR